MNLILHQLIQVAGERLLSDSKRRSFETGSSVASMGEAIEWIAFPSSGLLSSVVSLEEGETVETAMIGRAGVLGAMGAFGDVWHTSNWIGQIGGEILYIPTAAVRAIINKYESARRLLLLAELSNGAQTAQLAACNARHNIEQRVASWLLRASEAMDSFDLSTTQQSISRSLGVQRPSICDAIARLGKKRAIAHRRNHIAIIDRQALSQAACGCQVAFREALRTSYSQALYRQ